MGTGFSDFEEIASGTAAGGENRMFVAHEAASLGAATIDSEKKWHVKILTAECQEMSACRRTLSTGWSEPQGTGDQVVQGLLSLREASHDVTDEEHEAGENFGEMASGGTSEGDALSGEVG